MRDSGRRIIARSSNIYLIIPLAFLVLVAIVVGILYLDSKLEAQAVSLAVDAENLPSQSIQVTKARVTSPLPKPKASTVPSTTQVNSRKGTEKVLSERAFWKSPEEMFEYIKERHSKDDKENVRVSKLMICLEEQYVLAFAEDKTGESEVLHIFPCSTGYIFGHTPLGLHSLGFKSETPWLFDNSIAQYGGQISGNILFHSLPSYSGEIHTGLKLSDLNAMGQAASHGCVRLYCMDAKWIYDHCPSGTPIEVVEKRPAELNKLPTHLYYLRLKTGAPKWDPTDPHKDNPYRDKDTFLKWTVAEPWCEKYEVIPPVWPGEPDAEREPMRYAPAPQSTGVTATEPESESSEAETTPKYTGPTSPPPLEKNEAEVSERITSPPPLTRDDTVEKN